MYKLAFYVPLEDAEAVKEAVFATGAGRDVERIAVHRRQARVGRS